VNPILWWALCKSFRENIVKVAKTNGTMWIPFYDEPRID
jgi:hypothetical protein